MSEFDSRIKVVYSKTGFGSAPKMVKIWRPYAVYVDGYYLISKGGTIRTFGSRSAARQAAEAYCETRVTSSPVKNNV